MLSVCSIVNGGSYRRATSIAPCLAMWFWSRPRNRIWDEFSAGFCWTKAVNRSWTDAASRPMMPRIARSSCPAQSG